MIDLWVADIEAAGFVPHTVMEWLAPDERRKLERIRGGGDRRRYLVGRILLRNALASATGITPAGLRFQAPREGGKPELAAVGGGGVGNPSTRPGANSDVTPDFNLSHSGSAVVLAVSRSHEVGIDVEQSSAANRLDPRGFLSDDETDRLRELAPPAQARAALRLWTLKEAYAKLLGSGLECDLRGLALPPTGSAIQLEYRTLTIRSEEYGLAIASRPRSSRD